MADYGKMLSKEAQNEESREKHAGDGSVNWPDVNEQLRGALRRMASTAEKMDALPEGCTFTVAVELREEGLAPIGVSYYSGSFCSLGSVMRLIVNSIRRLGFRRSRTFRLRRRVVLRLVVTWAVPRQCPSAQWELVRCFSSVGLRKARQRRRWHRQPQTAKRVNHDG
jgi:hypothetical protein